MVAARERRWHIDAERDSDAAVRLEQAMAEAVLPYRVTPTRIERRGRAAAELRHFDLGELSLAQTDVPDVFSGATRVDSATVDRLLVIHVARGEQFVEQRDQQLRLGPGDLFVVDGAGPGRCTIPQRLGAYMLAVPRSLVDTRLGAPRYLPASSPVARLVGEHLRLLTRELGALPDAAVRVAAGATAELVRLIATTSEPAPGSEALRVALLPQVRRYIERNLGDCDLGPAEIAGSNSISVRTLHAMFEPTGETVGAFIRRRRLEQSKHELITNPGAPVSEVAVRWGFRNPRHFSRVFNEMFGCTPSAVRTSP